ncbi:uncharacterized protein [Physcomitrium patens]|uniref:uncharacterized protein isoform X2 n=1 Tax=Physcomitrium patens TaxID=3218 RepID=UPI003CCD2ADF
MRKFMIVRVICETGETWNKHELVQLKKIMESNSGFIPAQLANHAESIKVKRVGNAKQKPRKNTAKVATISLEEYINVFDYLTQGQGDEVKPIHNMKSIACSGDQLKSVLKLHNIPLSNRKTKEKMFQELLGKELWNPYGPPPDTTMPVTITEEEILEDLRVLECISDSGPSSLAVALNKALVPQ